MWKQAAVSVLTLALVAGAAHAKPAEAVKPQSETGELRQLVIDDFKSGKSRTETFLRLDDGRELRLRGSDLGQISGGRVTVSGELVDGQDFLVQDIQQAISYRTTVSNLTSGPQNALVVLTHYASVPAPSSYGLTEIGQVIDAAAAFWVEDSYGLFSLVPSYVDWTAIGDTPGGELGEIFPKVVDAVDPTVDFSQVDMLIIVGETGFARGAGQAFLTPISVDTDEGTQTMRIFQVDTSSTPSVAVWEFIAKHELTHTVGLKHAVRWFCGDEPLAPSGCVATFEDDTNIMRPNSTARPGHHTHAHQKLKATYLDESQVTTVSETGVYTIDPLALSGPGIRALRMATPAQTPLWIEYRQPIGLDVGMDDAPVGQTSTIYDGALLTLPINSLDDDSALVDSDFSQGNFFDGLHYTLLPGMTLEDPASGASITTVSATPSGLTVAIEVDCQDSDGDGYGENCLAGDDCDDSDPAITDSGPADVDFPTGEYLSFGDVRIDQVGYMALEIVNTGCESLAILGMNSPDPDFVFLNKVVTVAPKSSRTVVVRFTPSELGPDRSDLLFQTSDMDEQWVTVIAIANAVSPQELDYSPGSFSVLLPTGGTATELLNVSNLGGAALNYWIQNQSTVPWLDIDDDEALASIPGFGQNQVALNFNAAGQCSATGSVTLRMLTNDDDENEIFIPVDWEVYDAPDVAFNRNPADVIQFDDPGNGTTLQIENAGCQPLTIQSLVSSKPNSFSAPFSGPVTLAAGETYTQGVTFDGCPRRGGFAQCGARLAIDVNDPDEGTTEFLLFGTGFAP